MPGGWQPYRPGGGARPGASRRDMAGKGIHRLQRHRGPEYPSALLIWVGVWITKRGLVKQWVLACERS